MFKKSSYLFRLELNGAVIRECSSDDIANEITIGRSDRCDWVIPAEDRGASGVHAKICRKGKHFFIQDQKSRNGIYFMGAKIQERKVAVGDLYSIGDCKLTVEYQESTRRDTASAELYHKIEQLSGKDRGKIYRLTEDNIKIGSSPGCAIVLEDSLVSHLHAVLENHSDGSCWIKDMGSRNGTKVNNTMLSEENAATGRMLKDGDIISIAYIDFRFWDKSVVHVRSHLFLKVAVVVATLAIVLGGYFAFQTISPSAKRLRLKAEACAAQEDFKTARELLKTALSARGADDDAAQRMDLLRKLEIWQETLESWRRIRKMLDGKPDDGDLYDANDLFAKLASSDRERWQWNVAQASVEMKKAMETQALLSALLSTEDRMKHADADISYIKTSRAKLAEALAACRKDPQSYQQALMTRANDLVREMEQQIADFDAVQKIMDGCSAAARIDATIAGLEKQQSDSEARSAARRKAGKASSRSTAILCRKLLLTLRDLQASRKIYDRNCEKVAEFKFSDFEQNLNLPPVESCIISPNLSRCRLEMEVRNRQLEMAARQLKNFSEFFKINSIAPGMKSPLLTLVFDRAVWERVLDFDCLKLAQPSYAEKKARSDYDRMLGVYAFWEYLRSVGGDFDTTIFEERFKPELFRSREVFSNLETFLAFCEPREKAPLHDTMKRLVTEKQSDSVLTAHIAVARGILRRRDEVVKRMYEIHQESPDVRRGIVAGGIAYYLAPDGWSGFKPEKLAASLTAAMRKLRKQLADINESSQEATPEQVIANEKKILEIGIPGDSFLKQPWSDRGVKGQ